MERFWSKVDVGLCWEWTGGVRGSYGRFWMDGKSWCAHRFAWELLVGPIPDGLQLDHLCRNRLCVNPDHLEPVTLRDNLRRGMNVQRLKMQCPQGHPYDECGTAGTQYGGQWRRRWCKVCAAKRQRERRKVRV